MIKELSVRPKPQNNNAKILTGAFFTLFAIAFLVSMRISRFSGVVATAAMFLLVSALLVYTKYVSVSFCYDLVNGENDEGLFVVRQTLGKRNQTLCRISLRDIVKIEKETRQQRRAHKTERGVMRYSYTPTLSPAVSYRIFVKNRYESCEIVIEGNDEFIELITRYSEDERLNYIESEEG